MMRKTFCFLLLITFLGCEEPPRTAEESQSRLISKEHLPPQALNVQIFAQDTFHVWLTFELRQNDRTRKFLYYSHYNGTNSANSGITELLP